jgi:hypothetical protein
MSLKTYYEYIEIYWFLMRSVLRLVTFCCDIEVNKSIGTSISVKATAASEMSLSMYVLTLMR